MSSFKWQGLQDLGVQLTFDSHIVQTVLCPSFVSRLALVHTHIVLGELWDVQVRLSAGRVSERLAILTIVNPLAAEGEADPAALVAQVQIPEDVQDLVPCFIVTLESHVNAQVKSLISDNWKGQKWTSFNRFEFSSTNSKTINTHRILKTMYTYSDNG